MKIGSGAYEMYRTERKAKTTRILSKHVQYRTQPTHVWNNRSLRGSN